MTLQHVVQMFVNAEILQSGTAGQRSTDLVEAARARFGGGGADTSSLVLYAIEQLTADDRIVGDLTTTDDGSKVIRYYYPADAPRPNNDSEPNPAATTATLAQVGVSDLPNCPWRYYFHFLVIDEHRKLTGTAGWRILNLQDPITTDEAIQAISEYLAEKGGFPAVLIAGFQLIAAPPAGQRPGNPAN